MDPRRSGGGKEEERRMTLASEASEQPDESATLVISRAASEYDMTLFKHFFGKLLGEKWR